MKGIDPKYIMYLGLLVTIEQAIGHGTVSLTNIVPVTWAPYVTNWCNLLAFIGTTIMTGQAAISSNMPGPLIDAPKPPLAPTIVKILIAAFLLSAFLPSGSALAQNATRLPRPLNLDPLGLTSRSPSGGGPLEDIMGALDAKLLPDLQYALKLATASGSKVTAPCYQAWIDIINVRQKAVQGADGQDLPMPDPAIVTKFEKMVELRNSLQPDSDFMIKCSPVASMVKKDIVGFIGIVLSGGAGLATLVPGL